MAAGQVVRAFDPWDGIHHGYETGNWTTGCFYHKCANGYALMVDNDYCKQGHNGTNTWASGWPACPHGYIRAGVYNKNAHCSSDSGCDRVPGDHAQPHLLKQKINYCVYF